MTDRLEKIEKTLTTHKICSEEQLSSQNADLITPSVLKSFSDNLVTSLDQVVDEKTLRQTIDDELKKLDSDDQWYELYKNYTSEKDIAMKD